MENTEATADTFGAPLLWRVCTRGQCGYREAGTPLTAPNGISTSPPIAPLENSTSPHQSTDMLGTTTQISRFRAKVVFKTALRYMLDPGHVDAWTARTHPPTNVLTYGDITGEMPLGSPIRSSFIWAAMQGQIASDPCRKHMSETSQSKA